MKQHLLFAFVALLALGGVALFNTLNPPPPANYKIVYLGSKTCGTCQVWKKRELQAWKRDPISQTAKLELATLNGRPWTGGYGRHDPVFREAFKGKTRISWPSFALYSNGEYERLYVGLKGWRQLEKRVRAEAKRVEKLEAKAAS